MHERLISRIPRSFSEVSCGISDEILEKHRKLLMGYFRAQQRIALGQKKRAGKLLNALERHGLLELEDGHEDVLIQIDIYVRKSTNRIIPFDI